MPLSYNPIVRTFGQVRVVLVSVLGVDRRLVCPATPLDAIIPTQRYEEVLDGLRESGFQVRDLERQITQWPLCGFVPLLLVLAILVPLLLKSWLVFAVATALVIAFCVLACRVTRTRVLELPLGPRTVGELVIYLTRFSEHEDYRFSRNEIGLKVRFVIADWLGVPLNRVREDSRFIDLESW